MCDKRNRIINNDIIYTGRTEIHDRIQYYNIITYYNSGYTRFPRYHSIRTII